MMTSNRPLEDWAKLIGDVPAATAILDRFLQHATIINITGKSYRLRAGGAAAAHGGNAEKANTTGPERGRAEDAATVQTISSGSTGSPQAGAGAAAEQPSRHRESPAET